MMIETGTLLLTTPPLLPRTMSLGRDERLSELRGMLPGIDVLTIGSEVPAQRFVGRIWCFVDWLLPQTSGLELCRRLRDLPETAQSHITMVLDEDDADSRRRALRVGADDYIPGPLTVAALVERMQQYRSAAPVRSPARALAGRLVHGDLMIDTAAHHARWHGKVIALRPNEFRLLAHFVANPDQVFSRSSLIATLGKEGEAIDERTVDVWIGRLRRALVAHGAPDPLRTVRSMGYVLDSIESV